MKWYAVLEGRVMGVYSGPWGEPGGAEDQVVRFPYADYKGFPSRQAAEDHCRRNGVTTAWRNQPPPGPAPALPLVPPPPPPGPAPALPPAPPPLPPSTVELPTKDSEAEEGSLKRGRDEDVA